MKIKNCHFHRYETKQELRMLCSSHSDIIIVMSEVLSITVLLLLPLLLFAVIVIVVIVDVVLEIVISSTCKRGSP